MRLSSLRTQVQLGRGASREACPRGAMGTISVEADLCITPSAEHGHDQAGKDSLNLKDLRLGKEVVQGFQQADVVDGFAEQVQHLQAQHVAHVVHVGMAGGDDHR